MKRSIFYRLNRHNRDFKVAVKAIIFVMIECILLCTTGHARDLTFLVTSDPHYGYESVEVSNPAQITAMNNLPGKLYPAEIGGTVDTPSFVLVSGDLTNHSTDASWSGPTGFLAQYGLNGTDGMLHYPVYEGRGNNDNRDNIAINNSIISRHGNLYYSFNADGVHVVCLDDCPTLVMLNWLNGDLASMSDPCTPVILFQHRPFTDSKLDLDRQYYMSIIGNYKILALFYGHLHDSSHLLYDDPYSDAVYDTFMADTPTLHPSPNYFYAVHITDSTMTVVENNWSGGGQWRNYYVKTYDEFIKCDLYKDGNINFLDFAIFAEQWMQIDCGQCSGTDFTGDGNVDFNDLTKLADNWLDSRV